MMKWKIISDVTNISSSIYLQKIGHNMIKTNGYYDHKIPGLILYVFLLVNVAGCQTTVEEPGNQLQRVAMVSILDSSYAMSASKNVVSWKPNGSYLVPSDRIKTDTLKPIIDSAISKALQNRGYQFVSDSGNAQLLVSYIAALETELSDDDITRRFGVMPGFRVKNPDEEKYAKGTIIVDIMDVNLGKSVWRGAIQGFASIELSQEERHKRIDKIMSDLIGQFPAIL